jgi:hypothetical protein
MTEQNTKPHKKDINSLRKKGLSRLAEGQNIVNTEVWAMDETYFTDKIVLLLVINLKTTAVIGSCIAKSTEDDQKAYIYASEIMGINYIIDSGIV